MIIGFPKLDKDNKVIANEFNSYDTELIKDEKTRRAVETNISRVSTLNIIVDSLVFSRDNLQNFIKEKVEEANALVQPKSKQENK